MISGANGFWLRSILNPPTAKADRAENRIRRYEGEPAYAVAEDWGEMVDSEMDAERPEVPLPHVEAARCAAAG